MQAVLYREKSVKNSGEGGIRTHGDPKNHNGFRDRPDQPLRHLSEQALLYQRLAPILVPLIQNAPGSMWSGGFVL